jgi:integrase
MVFREFHGFLGGIEPMPVKNDSYFRHLKPAEKDYKRSDGGGLFMLVTKTGSKLWRYAYNFDAKQKLLAIGPYPHVSLADARLRGTVGAVFRFAIATGRAERDPTGDLRGALITPTVTHRATIVEPNAVGALLRAIDGFEGQAVTRYALKLASLVLVRPSELRKAEWTEFNLIDGEWRIPGAKMKMRRPHRVPLAPPDDPRATTESQRHDAGRTRSQDALR